MKKEFVYVLILVIVLSLLITVYYLFDSSDEKYNYSDEDFYAIKYLGYDADLSENIYDVYSVAGDEYYLIESRYDDVSVEIYELYMEDDSRELMHTFSGKDSFIVSGNQSDIFPNILIVLMYQDGNVVEINPFISLEDGSLIVGDEAFIVE